MDVSHGEGEVVTVGRGDRFMTEGAAVSMFSVGVVGSIYWWYAAVRAVSMS